jgi:hypothetical protein
MITDGDIKTAISAAVVAATAKLGKKIEQVSLDLAKAQDERDRYENAAARSHEEYRKRRPRFVLDLGSCPVIKNDNDELITALPRYLVWGHDLDKRAYQLIGSGDDLDALKVRYTVKDEHVFSR